MRLSPLALSLVIACGPSAADQDASARDAARDAGLASCRFGDFFVESALDVSEPGSNLYVVPPLERLDALGASIDAAIDGDLPAASAAAADASYALCEDGDLLVWHPNDATGQARIAWRRSASRSMILEAPHPFFDGGTLEEASALFDAMGARVLIASGTHRCANTAPGCEGSSTACGLPDGYRESDAAHNVIATFQRAHERFVERFATDLVISVHGFADDGVSISDGTNDAVSVESPVSRLAAALVALGVAPVTACNTGAGVDVQERLCGTTNVQGRHVNGSLDACSSGAPSASGRFVHMEQSSIVRDDHALVISAFEMVF